MNESTVINKGSLRLTIDEEASASIEIIEKYLLCNEDGKYDLKLSQILEQCDIDSTSLYSIIDNHCSLTISTDKPCLRCLGETRITLGKRRGPIVSAYKKKLKHEYCGKCAYALKEEYLAEEKKRRAIDDAKERKKCYDIIMKLDTESLRILRKIYKIKKFELIKKDLDVFPVQEYKHRAVWKIIFNLERMDLIGLDRNYAETYVTNILLYQIPYDVLVDHEKELADLSLETNVTAKIVKSEGNKLFIQLPHDVSLQEDVVYELDFGAAEIPVSFTISNHHPEPLF